MRVHIGKEISETLLASVNQSLSIAEKGSQWDRDLLKAKYDLLKLQQDMAWSSRDEEGE